MIRVAADRQRVEAVARLETLLPGLGVQQTVGQPGLNTPRLLRVPDAVALVEGVGRRVDDILRQGDLSARRGSIVSGSDHHARQITTDLATARSTPTATLNLEPFVGRRELLSGNTVNLNDAQHRLGGAVADLCDDLTVAFRSHTQVNVYVSKGDAPGFGAHWDDHDVVVIPVSGAKYWDVDEPHELGAIKDVTPMGGTGRSVWSGVLRLGDALAIPRGWPHRVSGLGDEVSVHLTASIRRPTALDLLAHQPPEFLEHPARFGPEEFEACLGAWCSILTLSPTFGPIQLTDIAGTGYEGVRLRAVLPGGAVFLNERCDADTVTLSANNRTVAIARPLAPVVAALVDRAIGIDDLAAATGTTRDDVLFVVDQLGVAGLIRWDAA
jgi:hypothetical protein